MRHPYNIKMQLLQTSLCFRLGKDYHAVRAISIEQRRISSESKAAAVARLLITEAYRASRIHYTSEAARLSLNDVELSSINR